MDGLGTRIAHSDYPSDLLDRRFEDRRIGQEEAQMLTRPALELALTKARITQLTGHSSPDPAVSLAGRKEKMKSAQACRSVEKRSVGPDWIEERARGVLG